MQRVIWRAAFDDFLDEVNGDKPASFAPPKTPPEPATRVGVVTRARRSLPRVAPRGPGGGQVLAEGSRSRSRSPSDRTANSSDDTAKLGRLLASTYPT